MKAKIIELDDAVIVTRESDGKVRLHRASVRSALAPPAARWRAADRAALPSAVAGHGLIVLVRKVTPDKILENVQERGHVIQSSWSNEAEARLNEALSAAGSSG
jgi:uncharacterized membrane protein